jgi:Ca-activated chloride channel family protein
MKAYYGHRIKSKQTVASKALKIIKKLLVVFSIYLVFGILFQHVYANVTPDENIDPYQSQHGSVWLLPDNGIYLEALQMQTDVKYEVTGSIARARIKQQFINSSEFWAEGIYVFPLPEKAAVDHFRMIIGERIIEGQIKERVLANKIYERAKSAGKKASLIEQQRPNVFTTSLANIAPGEEITVEFEFQQVLDYKENSYRLRFPMVVGPRYHTNNSSPEARLNQAANETSVYTETDPDKNANNPTRIHIMIDAGVSLAKLDSSYHKIHINQTSETRYSISTVGQNIISNRDFELVWKPELTDKPQLTAFNENMEKELKTDNYTMLTLLPPDLEHLQQKMQARDVIFVLDISGSMSGISIDQAKASLLTALEGLSSIDRFNIIWFNNETGSLFPDAVPATTKYKNYASLLIQQLQADGGTEMLPALKLALSNQEEFSRFRQVVFLTDGNINNETELFDVIDKQLANSRLFTIGIGSAPNSYFMRKAANKGRGTFTYIGNINEVHEKTVALFKKLETPALINIQLDIDRDKYEVFPKIIPDLYAGEALTLFIKGKQIPQSISLKGDYGNTEWQTSKQLKPASQSGIRIAWAREKIASLMNQHHESSDHSERETVKTEITNTALQHHLVSRYTSMVAVDVTPVNADGMLYRERLKNNLPHGWKNSAASNGLMLAQTAAGSTLNLFLSFLFFIGAMLMHRFFYRGEVVSKHSGIAE